ncbi:MAG: hypothetical protein M0Z59_10935 [Nitrospiraceae bacterium]|nr:hypothetical protein [Nitrospiraceae bacterium]
MVTVDVRGLKDKEPFKKVREALGRCEEGELVNVLVGTEHEARQMRSFMVMSGCNVDLSEKDGHWELKMTGKNCNCG